MIINVVLCYHIIIVIIIIELYQRPKETYEVYRYQSCFMVCSNIIELITMMMKHKTRYAIVLSCSCKPQVCPRNQFFFLVVLSNVSC